MAIVCFVASLSALKAQTENPLHSINAQLRNMYSQINPAPEPRNFLYERSAHRADSAFFAKICDVPTDENNFTITYEEVRDMASDQSVMPTSDELYTQAVDGLDAQSVPLALIDYDFYYLKDDALTPDLYFEFDSTLNVLKDLESQPTHPYSAIQNIFTGSSLRFDVPNGVVKFIISPQFILFDAFNKPYYTIRQFRIDFGDGNGLMAFDPQAYKEHTVAYSSAGEKIIRIAIVDENNPSIVKKSSLHKIWVGGVNPVTQPDGVLEGVEGFDTAVYFPCEASKDPNNDFKKTAIYLEGFDVLEDRSTDDIYRGMLKDSRVEDLRNSGYTFLVLSYKNGRKHISDNAMHLVALLHRLKTEAIERDNDEQFVIIGESMGGLVARYALCYMETEAYRERYRPQDNRMHNTRLLITLDSPHQGANVPLSMQAMYRYMGYDDPNQGKLLALFMNAPRRFAASKINAFLDGDAAKEMLLHYYNYGAAVGNFDAHPKRQAFLNDLAGLGKYPQFCKKVALSNGSLDGERQRRPYGERTLRAPGDELLNFQAGLGVRIPRIINQTIYIVSGRVVLRTNPNGTMQKPIASIEMGFNRIRIKIGWFGIRVTISPSSAYSWTRYANASPICTSSGGRNEMGNTNPQEGAFDTGFDWIILKAKFINDGNGNYMLNIGTSLAGLTVTMRSDGRHFCFIPTASALDYHDSNNYQGGIPHLNRNIRGENINQKLAKTRFDVMMGWWVTRNQHHLAFRNEELTNNTALGGNRRSCPHELITRNAGTPFAFQEQRYSARLLNREIGDEQLYLENLTLNRKATFTAEHDIFVNIRNPRYEYPSQPTIINALDGIYSKEAPLILTAPDIEATFIHETLFDFQLPKTGMWKPKKQLVPVCCNAYIQNSRAVKPAEQPAPTAQESTFMMFPNPNADRKLTLQYQLLQAEPLKVEIASMQGNTLMAIELGNYQTGTTTLDLTSHRLPAGTYMVIFRTASKTFIQRLILH